MACRRPARRRAGSFPDAAKAYENRLKQLGKPARMVLVDRREVGDDRVYQYELTFGDRVYYYSVSLAKDDRVSGFRVWPK